MSFCLHKLWCYVAKVTDVPVWAKGAGQGRAGSTVGIHRQHRIPNIIDIEAAWLSVPLRCVYTEWQTHTRIMWQCVCVCVVHTRKRKPNDNRTFPNNYISMHQNFSMTVVWFPHTHIEYGNNHIIISHHPVGRGHKSPANQGQSGVPCPVAVAGSMSMLMSLFNAHAWSLSV